MNNTWRYKATFGQNLLVQIQPEWIHYGKEIFQLENDDYGVTTVVEYHDEAGWRYAIVCMSYGLPGVLATWESKERLTFRDGNGEVARNE